MNAIAKELERAITLCGAEVRERLNGDQPIDWATLESTQTIEATALALTQETRLPKSIERLCGRMAAKLGMCPHDIATRTARTTSLEQWSLDIALEARAETYVAINTRTAKRVIDIEGGALCGYAVLALELATLIASCAEQWREIANNGHRDTIVFGWAKRMRKEIAKLEPEREPSIHEIGCAIERAWNTQWLDTRATLAKRRMKNTRDLSPPQCAHYAPKHGFRLQAGNPGALRWLKALAREVESEAFADESANRNGEEATQDSTAQLRPKAPAPGTAGELMRAASKLPGSARRRIAETYGQTTEKVIEQAHSTEGAEALIEQVMNAQPGAHQSIWAITAIIADATAPSIQVESRRGELKEYEQHSLLAALIAALKHTADTTRTASALVRAGAEAEWAREEASSNENCVAESDAEMLEAAERLGAAMEATGDPQEKGEPTAFETAIQITTGLEAAGPTVRLAAGWPASAKAPDPNNPDDIARCAEQAETLNTAVRRIANQIIAGWLSATPEQGTTENSKRMAS